MSKAAKANSKSKLKIVLIGDGRTGKSSCIRRFLTNSFDECEESTLEAKMHQGIKMEGNGSVWDVFLWDTAGQERFRALAPIYYRDADGALLVYDITDKDSFTRVRVWMKELHKVVGEDVVVVVAGNKCDLERERKVTKREAEDWCNENNCKHVLVSAKLGLRITEAFQSIVAGISAKRAAAAASSPAAGGAGSRQAGDIGGDILPGRAPRQMGARVKLDEEPRGFDSSAGGSGGGSSAGGGGSASGGGKPCAC